VRDARATLEECLGSLRAQELTDHEVVAVDDGSHDGSRDLLDAAARRDPRVRVLDNPGRGLVAALNAAAAAARAPLLARLDADDRADPRRLALQAARLQAVPELSILGTGVRLFGAERPNAGMRAYVAWLNGLREHADIVRDIWVESPLAHPSVMLRAAVLRTLGGYREVDGPEDYDLWLRAHGAGVRFASLPEVLLDWRDGPSRLSRTDGRYAPERFRAVKIEALERGPLRGRGVVLWGAGPIGKGWAKALQERGHPVLAFVEVAARKVGERIHGAPVVGVSEASSVAPRALHLAAVGQPGARARIRAEAASQGLVDGEDLLAVA
jgi:glycosyltransferase involved in cell wall biosynthesis